MHFIENRKQELIVLILLVFISGAIAKVPFLFNIDPELFYPRNIGTIVFPTLITYLSLRYKFNLYIWLIYLVISFITIIFLNLIPGGDNSDTFFLSSTHSLFFLFSICGLVYIGGIRGNNNKRIDFLHYCGDLIIMSGLLFISGGIFTAITIGLFQLIGFNIEDFYFENVVVWGLPSIPLIASYLILIVLFAISSRLFELGITPNRLALTGLNLLVSFHLLIISKQLLLLVLKKANTNNILNSIVRYLPIYVIWTAIVVFLFPIIFNFK